MERKAVSGTMLTLLLIGTLGLAFYVGFGGAGGTIVIEADGSINPPSANITSSDNITYTFTNNNYDEIVVERSNIVVDGNGYTLEGSGSGMGIGIISAVSNVTIKNMEIDEFYYGIWINASSNYNSISGNNMTNNIYGIWLWHSSNNSVDGNNITANNDVGIYLYDSNNNTVSGNNITNNYDGIYLEESSNNMVSGNTASNNNHFGIYLWSSSNNTVSGNTASNNTNVGIVLSSSSDNVLFHNNFIDNTVQAVVTAGYVNIWDDGYPSGGNYWSGYTGVDLHWGPNQDLPGSDGIIDIPYEIIDGNQDNYPLMSPYEYWINPILGDINRDMKVDRMDLLQLAAAYGSIPGKPNWNPNCDFNQDYKVEVLDLSNLGKNYGKIAS